MPTNIAPEAPIKFHMKHFHLIAFIISALIALPLAFFSMTIAYSSSGDTVELLKHPGFWMFYWRGWAWFFAAGVICSATSFWVFQRVTRGS
jgi:hypothetical protein